MEMFPGLGGASQQVNVEFAADVSGYTASLGEAIATTEQFGRVAAGVGGTTAKMGIALTKATANIMGSNKAMMSPAVQQAAAYQQVMSGLEARTKTAGREFKEVGTAVRDMAREFPVGIGKAVEQFETVAKSGVTARGALEGIAKATLQVGAATGNMSPAFTQTLIDYQRISGGRTGMTGGGITKSGDMFVGLGARMGVDEQSTADLATSFAPMASMVGATQSQTAGVAAAFQKAGVEGRLGSQVFNTIMSDMERAAREGGTSFHTYAEAIGESNQAIKDQLKNNPMEVATKFLEAVGEADPTAIRQMEKLGYGSRTVRSLREVAKSGGVRDAMQISAASYADGSTMQAAEASFGGLNDSIATTNESLGQLVEASGRPLVGAFTELSDAAGGVASFFAKIMDSGLMQGLMTAGIVMKGVSMAGGVMGGSLFNAATYGAMAPGNIMGTMDKVRGSRAAQFIGRNKGMLAMGGLAGMGLGMGMDNPFMTAIGGMAMASAAIPSAFSGIQKVGSGAINFLGTQVWDRTNDTFFGKPGSETRAQANVASMRDSLAAANEGREKDRKFTFGSIDDDEKGKNAYRNYVGASGRDAAALEKILTDDTLTDDEKQRKLNDLEKKHAARRPIAMQSGNFMRGMGGMAAGLGASMLPMLMNPGGLIAAGVLGTAAVAGVGLYNNAKSTTVHEDMAPIRDFGEKVGVAAVEVNEFAATAKSAADNVHDWNDALDIDVAEAAAYHQKNPEAVNAVPKEVWDNEDAVKKRAAAMLPGQTKEYTEAFLAAYAQSQGGGEEGVAKATELGEWLKSEGLLNTAGTDSAISQGLLQGLGNDVKPEDRPSWTSESLTGDDVPKGLTNQEVAQKQIETVVGRDYSVNSWQGTDKGDMSGLGWWNKKRHQIAGAFSGGYVGEEAYRAGMSALGESQATKWGKTAELQGSYAAAVQREEDTLAVLDEYGRAADENSDQGDEIGMVQYLMQSYGMDKETADDWAARGTNALWKGIDSDEWNQFKLDITEQDRAVREMNIADAKGVIQEWSESNDVFKQGASDLLDASAELGVSQEALADAIMEGEEIELPGGGSIDPTKLKGYSEESAELVAAMTYPESAAMSNQAFKDIWAQGPGKAMEEALAVMTDPDINKSSTEYQMAQQTMQNAQQMMSYMQGGMSSGSAIMAPLNDEVLQGAERYMTGETTEATEEEDAQSYKIYAEQVNQAQALAKELLSIRRNYDVGRQRLIEDTNIAIQDATIDHNTQMKFMQEDHATALMRAERDFTMSIEFSTKQHHQQQRWALKDQQLNMQRREDDFYLGRERAEEDRETARKRRLEDMSAQVLDPYKQREIKSVTGFSSMLSNVNRQNEQLAKQQEIVNLLKARGLSEQAIAGLQLADPKNLDQALYWGSSAITDEMIAEANAAFMERENIMGSVYDNSPEGQRESEDWARNRSRELDDYIRDSDRSWEDFYRNRKRANKQFKQQMDFQHEQYENAISDMNDDLQRQLDRSDRLFVRQMNRMRRNMKRQLKRMYEDMVFQTSEWIVPVDDAIGIITGAIDEANWPDYMGSKLADVNQVSAKGWEGTLTSFHTAIGTIHSWISDFAKDGKKPGSVPELHYDKKGNKGGPGSISVDSQAHGGGGGGGVSASSFAGAKAEGSANVEPKMTFPDLINGIAGKITGSIDGAVADIEQNLQDLLSTFAEHHSGWLSGSGDDPNVSDEAGYPSGPAVRAIAAAVRANFPEIDVIGGGRADQYFAHPEGKAIDVMVADVGNLPSAKMHDIGEQIAEMVIQNAAAMDIYSIIWDKGYWSPGGGWRPYGEKGNITDNHQDHLHIQTKSWAGNTSKKGFNLGGPTEPLDPEFDPETDSIWDLIVKGVREMDLNNDDYGDFTGKKLKPRTKFAPGGASGGFAFPLPGGSYNTDRPYGHHDGTNPQDFGANSGTNVFSSVGGRVTEAGYGPERGNYAVVENDLWDTRYYHFVRPAVVKQGDMVAAGQLIGHVGTTGSSSGNHLHWEMHPRFSVPYNTVRGLKPLGVMDAVGIDHRYSGHSNAPGYSPKYFAEGGVVTGLTNAVIGELGDNEAVIPLNSQGVSVIAEAIGKYAHTFEAKAAQTAGHARPVVNKTTTVNDHSTQVSGPITVEAADTSQMLDSLRREARKNRLSNPQGAVR